MSDMSGWMRNNIIEVLVMLGTKPSVAEGCVDDLIAAVRAEALAEPSDKELGALKIKLKHSTTNLNLAVMSASIAAYRRMRGAE